MSFSSQAESKGSVLRTNICCVDSSEGEKNAAASSLSSGQCSEARQQQETNESTPNPSIRNHVASSLITTEPKYNSFGPRFKIVLVILVSAVATLSGLSSNVYFPAQTNIAKSLVISPEVVNLSITTYMIAQGLAPSFWSIYADHKGRRVTFLVTLIIYLIANIALAFSMDGTMLLVFRALQAIGSSSTIALGAGVITDIFSAEKRGAYIGWFSGIRQLSLACGPIIGGLLTQYLGWRSIFWFLAGFSGLALLLVVLFIPETLHRVVESQSSSFWMRVNRPIMLPLLGINTGLKAPPSTRDMEENAVPRPQQQPRRMKDLFAESFGLILELDVLCALVFGGCVYTAWSMMIASTTEALQSVYGFNTLQIGFCFLANGLGCIVGSVLTGRTLNTDFQREARLWQHEHGIGHETPFPKKNVPLSFPLEHARLAKGLQSSVVAIWSLLLYGWSLTAPDPSDDPKSHWITPLLAQFAAGGSATSVLASNNALLVDLYPSKSASASAMLNLGRCLLGAAGVAAVGPFMHRYGPGWTSVLLASIVAVGLVPYALHYTYGQHWRKERENRFRGADVIELTEA